MKHEVDKINVNDITNPNKKIKVNINLYIIICLLIIASLLICGCTETKTNNMEINTMNTINIDKVNKTNITDLNLNHTNINIETKTLQTEEKNLSYEILAYGSFGSKERDNYFYYLDNKTVIVINLGEMPTSGYVIKILNITKKGNNLTVFYTIIPPKNATAMVITYPYIKLYVNGTFDNVIFKEK
ncbi:conserved hypothetical protein [Methanocaldococcus vulcanius M7]|uniref:PrcB C-terminal domain-containing protein n=1 Tax=Methanocaldococcus vulcanius (strain ATCC 700851 / DSM 12094 / M7) TaxID=579137 RepID=C9RG87_METVM|nr:protease complex subunit PrcB family protein [Methanocaldococcus vulcanius]ACX72589.1 conserved hypothetical protein [Methanocaldococcus vulcanius M7]